MDSNELSLYNMERSVIRKSSYIYIWFSCNLSHEMFWSSNLSQKYIARLILALLLVGHNAFLSSVSLSQCSLQTTWSKLTHKTTHYLDKLLNLVYCKLGELCIDQEPYAAYPIADWLWEFGYWLYFKTLLWQEHRIYHDEWRLNGLEYPKSSLYFISGILAVV